MRLASTSFASCALILPFCLPAPFLSTAETMQEAPAEEEEAPELDPYFVRSSGSFNEAGPQVITRNVLQDRDGDIWLATWTGILRFDGTKFTNLTNKDNLKNFRVFSLLEDKDGDIWCGTVGAGVYRFDGKDYTQFTTKDGLANDVVLSVFQDKSGACWFGGHGATKYDGKSFTTFTKADGFTDLDVHHIDQSPDGTLWFGTRGALFRYDGKTFTDFTKEQGLSIGSYIPVLVDHQEHVWFSGDRGLFYYDGKQVRHLFEQSSFALFEDSKGRIWFSGGGLGGKDPAPGTTTLNRFDPKAGLDDPLGSSHQFEIANGQIFGLMEDADGNVWFGTGGGVGRIEGDAVRYY